MTDKQTARHARGLKEGSAFSAVKLREIASEKRSAQSRANGRKGGRPRKTSLLFPAAQKPDVEFDRVGNINRAKGGRSWSRWRRRWRITSGFSAVEWADYVAIGGIPTRAQRERALLLIDLHTSLPVEPAESELQK